MLTLLRIYSIFLDHLLDGKMLILEEKVCCFVSDKITKDCNIIHPSHDTLNYNLCLQKSRVLKTDVVQSRQFFFLSLNMFKVSASSFLAHGYHNLEICTVVRSTVGSTTTKCECELIWTDFIHVQNLQTAWGGLISKLNLT